MQEKTIVLFMPAPLLITRQFVFTHEVEPDADSGEAAPDPAAHAKRSVPVVCIALQVMSFGRRCFWVHVAESREGPSAPPTPLGPCAVSFSGVAEESAATMLIDDAALPQQGPRDGQQEVGAGAPSPQAMFADSLARRLSRCLERKCGSAVAVYVACGISGKNQTDLIGTTTGFGSDITMRFGSEVFRNTVELILQRVVQQDEKENGDR